MQVLNSLSLDNPIPLEIFKFACEQVYNQIIITDINGIILFANKSLERTTGYLPAEVLGKTPRVWGGLMDEEFYEEMWKCIKSDKKPFYNEVKNMKKNMEPYTAVLSIAPIVDHNDMLVGFVGTEDDAALYETIKNKLRIEQQASL